MGDKRNAAVRVAAGDLCANWDDDDWYSPDRLERQVKALQGKAVHGFNSGLFWDADNSKMRIYKGNSQYALGSTLLYSRQWAIDNPFPRLQVGEDNGFVCEARKKHQLVSDPAIGPIVALDHAGNTSKRVYSASWSEVNIVPEGFYL